MFSKSLTVLSLSLPLSTLILTTAAAGNPAAVKACDGFPSGALKCLTDVSYTVCQAGTGHGFEQEYFVAAGTHCEQGVPGQRKDVANVIGAAVTTRTFQQFGFDAASSSAGATTMTTSVVAGTATKAALGLSGPLNDAQKDSLFLTTATAGISRPQVTYVENFVTLSKTKN